MEKEIVKMYYSTGEVAKELGVTIPTVIAWLEIYDIKVKRVSDLYRKSRRLVKRDIDKLRIIKHLGQQGLSREGIKKFIKQNGWRYHGTI